MQLSTSRLYIVLDSRARNWPCPMVRDDQQSGKDEFRFTELVLLDIFGKD